MAHPEVIAPLVPETLPEDFSDWDGESSAAPLPGNSGEAETAHVLSEAPSPLEQSIYRDAVRASFPGVQRLWGSEPSTPTAEPVIDKQQNESVNWQREVPPAFVPRNVNEARAAYVLSQNPNSPGQSVAREASVSPVREASMSPVMDKPRDSRVAVSEIVVVNPQTPASELADELASHAMSSLDDSHTEIQVAAQSTSPDVAAAGEARNLNDVTAAKMREADEAIFQLFSSSNVEVEEERKPWRNKWVMVSAAGACSLLLSFALVIGLGHHGTKVEADQTIQPVPEAPATLVNASVSKPLAGEPSTLSKPRATSKSEPATDAAQDNSANPAPIVTDTQTKMMNDQLAAPRMISRDAAKQVAEDTPPPPSVSLGAEGSGVRGAIPGVLNGNAHSSVVQAPPPKPLVISSGIALGMLVQKTPPVYPPIAKSARVSGTVVLQAVISKNGTIADLQVVSGPPMLRAAAMDAVRTWRYKPYLLNNQPVETETTINVIFSIGA